MENVSDLIITRATLLQFLSEIVAKHNATCEIEPFAASHSHYLANQRLDLIVDLFSGDSDNSVYVRNVVANIRGRVSFLSFKYTPDLDSLKLTVRTTNALTRSGIFSVYQLTQKTEVDLLRLPGFCKRCLTEVKYTLRHFGFCLKGVSDDNQ